MIYDTLHFMPFKKFKAHLCTWLAKFEGHMIKLKMVQY